jgi:hypothetical protein
VRKIYVERNGNVYNGAYVQMWDLGDCKENVSVGPKC